MAGVEPPKAMFTAAVKGELSVCQQEMWAAETSGTNEESACKGNNNLENPEDCMPDPGTSELWLGVLKAARLKTLSLLSCYDVRPVAEDRSWITLGSAFLALLRYVALIEAPETLIILSLISAG